MHRHYNGANLGYAFFRLQNLFSCFLFPSDRACRRLSCLERAVCLSVFNLIYSFLLILFHFADFAHTFPLSFLPIPLATYCMLASQTPTQTLLQPLQLRVIFSPFSFLFRLRCCAVYALSFNSSTESTKIGGVYRGGSGRNIGTLDSVGEQIVSLSATSHLQKLRRERCNYG